MTLLKKITKKDFLHNLFPALLAGLAIFIIQLILFRESFVSISSNEMTIGFFYGFWLFGMGLGALTFKKGGATLKFLLLIPLSIVGIFILMNGRGIFRIPSSSIIYGSEILNILALAIIPVSFLAGSIIPSLGGTHKKLFISLEAFGSLIAGILYSFGGLAFINSIPLIQFFIIPVLGVASLLTWPKSRKLALVIIIPLLIIATVSTGSLLKRESKEYKNLISYSGQRGKITIAENKWNQTLILKNGYLKGIFPPFKNSSSLELIKSLLPSKERTVVVINDFPFSWNLAKNGGFKVLLITSDKRPWSYLLKKEGISCPNNLTIKQGDPLDHIPQKTGILVLPSIFPNNIKDHQISTREFYEKSLKKLENDGVVLINISLPGLFPPDPYLENLATARATLSTVFSNTHILIENNIWLYGSKNKVLPNSIDDFNKLKAAKLSSLIQDNNILYEQLKTKPSSISTLKNPILFLNTLKINPGGEWSKYLIGIKNGKGKIFVLITAKYLPLFLLIIIFAFLIFFRVLKNPDTNFQTGEVSWILFLTGFISIITQIHLFLALQNGSGNVLKDIGVVSGLFMFFLALGALKPLIPLKPKYQISLLLSSLAILTFSLPFITLFFRGPLFPILILSSLSGLITGMIIPPSFNIIKNYNSPLSLIFASDHIGAGVGAIVGGSLLLPANGSFYLFPILALSLLGTIVLINIPIFNKKRSRPPGAKTFPWPAISLIFSISIISIILFTTYIREDRSSEKTKIANLPGEKFKKNPFPHFEVRKRGKNFIKVNSFLLNKTKNIKGYAAPIETIVTFCPKGRIREIKLGSNNETPSFMRKVRKWSNQFVGIRARVDLYGKGGVDTISGATLSTKAVKDSIHISRNMVFKDILHIKQKKSTRPVDKFPLFLFLMTILLIISALIVSIMVNRPLRLILLISSFAILGVWLNLMISLVDFGLLYLNIMPSTPQKLILLGFITIISILFGAIWCGFLCPLGALQEIIFTTSRLFLSIFKKDSKISDCLDSKYSPKINKKLSTWLSYLKYILLGISMAGFALTGSHKFIDWEPLSFTFLGQIPSGLGLVILITLLLTSLFLFRPHCRFICPVGAFITIAGLFSPLKKYLPIRLIKNCDYGVKSTVDITCLRCNRCAIKRKTKKKKS
jgi:FMN-binding domain/4Fe-4S binding domain